MSWLDLGYAFYLDDVIVYNKTWDQHLKPVCVLFSHLAEAGLTINLLVFKLSHQVLEISLVFTFLVLQQPFFIV